MPLLTLAAIVGLAALLCGPVTFLGFTVAVITVAASVQWSRRT